MALVRKKQIDKNLKILREIVSLSGNKQCFDCGQRGPTYVNMSIGSFVCTRCSGMLRGLTPPQRVKSISMATFQSDEIEFIKAHGNEDCAKTWLGLWDPKRVHTQDQRELMIDKYERKRYYLEPASPLKSITNITQLAPSQSLNAQTVPVNGSSTKSISESNSSSGNTTTQSLWSISLTPPNNSSRPNNRSNGTKTNQNHFQQTFGDDNGLFNQTNGTRLNNNSNNINHVNNGTSHNMFNGNSMNSHNGLNVITKNSLKLQSSSISDNNNKFTPDADFVADFDSANIFNPSAMTTVTSTTASTVGTNTNGTSLQTNGHGINHNGAGKLSATTNHNGLDNGNGVTAENNANANFADFEHNPIYNAAANETYNANNNQWNIWQQFQWPYVQPEQNRWSLPMSLSSTSNSLKSSGTFNSNSSINSTPSADRYAALKDLDEQLREIKEKDNLNGQTSSSANPFKLPAQQQPAHNPFQASNQTQNSWLTDSQQFTTLNGGLPVPNGNLYPTQAFNGTNATAGNSPYINGFNGVQNHSQLKSGIGFNGISAQNGYAQKNPFAATNLNANNPFL